MPSKRKLKSRRTSNGRGSSDRIKIRKRGSGRKKRTGRRKGTGRRRRTSRGKNDFLSLFSRMGVSDALVPADHRIQILKEKILILSEESMKYMEEGEYLKSMEKTHEVGILTTLLHNSETSLK